MNKYLNNKSLSSSFSIKQSGFSLIEIMVAALILSIGILGVAGLQIVGMKGTHQSYMKQQAMSAVHSFTERMRSNVQGVIAGDYELTDAEYTAFDCATAPSATCTSATGNCTSASIANLDLHNTICGYQATGAQKTGGLKVTSANDISTFLGGKLRVSCPGASCATGDVRIALEWQERAYGKEDLDADNDGTDDVDSLVINTRILP